MAVKIEELTERAGKTIRENVAHIIFSAVIGLMIVLSFVDMGKGDGKIDWFNLIVNIVLQVSIFIPYRWRQKRISGQSAPYKENRQLYGDCVEALYKNNELKQFAIFCQQKTNELQYSKQVAIVQSAGIDQETFDFLTAKILSEEKNKQRDALLAALTDDQRKALARAQRITVKPVNPLCITSNSNKIKGYGVDFNEEAEDIKGIIGKIFPMLIWAVIISLIAIDSIKYGGVAAAVMIIFRIVMCLTAMFSGIMSGDGFVVKKDKVILRRIDFIGMFNEWLAAEKAMETTMPQTMNV